MKCIKYKHHPTVKCEKHGYKHLNDLNFNPKEFRAYVDKYYKEFSYENYKKEHKLKPHQKFVSKYIDFNSDANGVLLFHNTGSGKTLTAIVAGEAVKANLLNKQPFPKITVITPLQIKENFFKEIRSEMLQELEIDGNPISYARQSRRSRFFAGNVSNVNIAIEEIKSYWEIFTHTEFIFGLYTKTFQPGPMLKLLQEPNRLFIIDEVHNFITEEGEFYRKLFAAIAMHLHPSNKLLLLTATPIINKPYEMGLLLNLLKPRVFFPTTEAKFNAVDANIVKWMTMGYVSYFSGGSSENYPSKKIIEVAHKPEGLQKEAYKKLPVSKNFMVSLIQTALVHLPEDVSYRVDINKNIENLKKYSIKYYSLLKYIEKAKGTVVVYVKYKKYGTDFISFLLHQQGYTRYTTKSDTKEKRFVVWTGDKKDKKSLDFLEVFNSKENINGEYIKVVIGTDAISEGVSFKNVREMHIMHPWWNYSKMKQIEARVVRFRSHEDLPPNERKVTIYKHVLKIKNSIDLLFLLKTDQKTKDINKYLNIMKESAIDCNLNKKGNEIIYDEYINYKNEKYYIDQYNKKYKTKSKKYEDINCKVDNINTFNLGHLLDPKKSLDYIRKQNIKFRKEDLFKCIKPTKQTTKQLKQVGRLTQKAIKSIVSEYTRVNKKLINDDYLSNTTKLSKIIQENTPLEEIMKKATLKEEFVRILLKDVKSYIADYKYMFD